MRELKKVTVNVANVELYAGESGLKSSSNEPVCTCAHTCPSAYTIKNGSEEDALFTLEPGYGAFTNNASKSYYGGNYYCQAHKANHAHFLYNGYIYCYKVDCIKSIEFHLNKSFKAK